MGKIICSLIIVLTYHTFAYAEPRLSAKIEDEQDIMNLAVEGEISWDDYYTLSYLYLHPLDLNEAEIFQLEELPNISIDLAQQIYDKRPFISIEEIIPIIGKQIFDQIKVFIRVNPVWRGNLEVGLNEIKDDNKKADINYRLGLSTNEMKIGCSGSREDEIKLKKRYLLVDKSQAFLRRVVFGTYQARFGEGVAYNTAYRKTYQGIVPDDNTRKGDIQDGLIIETSFDKFNSTLFYSFVDLEEFPNYVLSNFDGEEKLWGINLGFAREDTRLGATSFVSNFTSKNGESRMVEMSGVDFSKRFKDAEMAGEIAKSSHHGTGLSLRADKKLTNFKCRLSLRRYEQDFINPHSQVKEGDEKGGSAQIQYDLNDLRVKLFIDYHQHFSTLITDEKHWSSMEYKLNPKVGIMAKIEYEDTDIARINDKREIYSFALDTKPRPKLDINSYYKQTNDDGAMTDYIYTKLSYHFKPGFILTGRFKYGPKEERETYGQVKVEKGNKELLAKYTCTYSNSYSQKFYLRMKIEL